MPILFLVCLPAAYALLLALAVLFCQWSDARSRKSNIRPRRDRW